MPPITPVRNPATGEAHGSQPAGRRGESFITFSTTKVTMKPPRMSMTVREDSITSSRVPTTVPIAPNAASGAMRRIVVPGAPCRRNWMPSITMFGTISTRTAVLMSTKSVSSGVPSVGNPNPIEPFTKAAAATATARSTAIIRSHRIARPRPMP
jgi:hypothetical protein